MTDDELRRRTDSTLNHPHYPLKIVEEPASRALICQWRYLNTLIKEYVRRVHKSKLFIQLEVTSNVVRVPIGKKFTNRYSFQTSYMASLLF